MLGSVNLDRNGLEVLERDDAVRLLESQTLGRIAITSGAIPVVLPVNFAVRDGEIIIRTSQGTKLHAATRNAVVAFEVDKIDPFSHAGWSVCVTGMAREVTDPNRLAAIERAGLAHWAPDGASRVIAISMEIVSGRRITRAARASAMSR